MAKTYTVGKIQGKNEEVVSNYFKPWIIISEEDGIRILKSTSNKEYAIIIQGFEESNNMYTTHFERVSITSKKTLKDLTSKLIPEKELQITEHKN